MRQLVCLLLLTTPLSAFASGQTCGGVDIFPDIATYPSTALLGVSGDGGTLYGSFGGLPTEQGATWTLEGDVTLLDRTGFTRSTVTASSYDGSIFAGWASSGGGSRPVRWMPGGAIEELLDPAGNSVVARAEVISDDGSVVAGNFFNIPPRPFRWTAAAGVEVLEDAGGADLVGDVEDMTPDGAVIVGRARVNGVFNGYRWTEAGGVEPLDQLFGMPGRAFDPQAISADGSTIVGSMSAPGFDNKPFVWTAASGVIDAYPKQTEPQARLLDVNADGTVAIGDERLPSNLEQTILWAPEVGLQRLEPISFGWINAFSISESGGVVVGQSRNPPFVSASVVLELSPLGATYCTLSPVNSTGCFARLRVEGDSAVAANDLTLRAVHLPPGSLGLFAVGSGPAAIPMPGTNVGTFCLATPLGRLARSVQVQTVGTNGEMVLDVDLARLPRGLAGQAGATLYFQGWFRETMGAGGSANFTDAVAVTLR